MSKKTKATYTQGRGSKAKGAYNPNHNTLEATRKGQSHIDEERMHLNRYIRFDRNGRGHTSAGGNGGFNATQHEKERYEELYGKGLDARNQRYLAGRHKERCRTMGEIYQDLKTAPLESIWQVGNSHSDMPKEEMRDALIKAWNMTIVEIRKNYGQTSFSDKCFCPVRGSFLNTFLTWCVFSKRIALYFHSWLAASALGVVVYSANSPAGNI